MYKKIKDFENSLGDDDSEYDKAEAILGPIATQITESDMEEAFQPKFFIATDVSIQGKDFFLSHTLVCSTIYNTLNFSQVSFKKIYM